MRPFQRRNGGRQAHSTSFLGAVAAKVPVSALFLIAHPALRVICTRPRDKEHFAQLDVSAMAQIAFFALAGLWLLTQIRHFTSRIPEVLFARPVAYLVGYLALAAFSALWSTHPTLTLYRCVEALICLGLIVHATLSARDLAHAFSLLAVYTLAAVACNTISGIRLHLLIGRASIAELLHANVGAAVAAVGLFLCLPFRKSRFLRLSLWVFAVAVLMKTSSATYIAVLATIFVLVLLRTSASFRGTAVVIAAGIVLIAFSLETTTFLSDLIVFPKTPAAVRTATGRLGMWQWYWDNPIRESPWIGHGYEAGEHQLRRGQSFISNAHNVFIAALVNVGVPGLVLIVLLAGSMVHRAVRIHGPPGTALFAASLCVWINSLTIPAISSRVRASWMVIAWISVLIGTIHNGRFNGAVRLRP